MRGNIGNHTIPSTQRFHSAYVPHAPAYVPHAVVGEVYVKLSRTLTIRTALYLLSRGEFFEKIVCIITQNYPQWRETPKTLQYSTVVPKARDRVND